MISSSAACCGTAKMPEHGWPACRRSVKQRNIVPRSCVIKSRLLEPRVQQSRICRSPQAGALDIEDINGWLARLQPLDQTTVKILIREEANRHSGFEESSCRAAARRAKSSGFVWLNRGADSKNRSPSAK